MREFKLKDGLPIEPYTKQSNIFPIEGGGIGSGSQFMTGWMLDGELHREDGPAIVSKYYCDWYVHGERTVPNS